GRWSLWRAALSLAFPRSNEDGAAVLARLGIADKLHERTDRLSGGEQQRVAIARVLVQEPAIMLADEPISNVDPARQREIIDLLIDSSERRAATLLVTLHDVGVALGAFPRVVGLRTGQVAFDVPSKEVSPEMIDDLYLIERSLGG
ncbi:MAG: ATP-binding cassette domain-containing protein, partial [Candidatus Limnocylindria bacterium]